jgi:hypothetical protein
MTWSLYPDTAMPVFASEAYGLLLVPYKLRRKVVYSTARLILLQETLFARLHVCYRKQVS